MIYQLNSPKRLSAMHVSGTILFDGFSAIDVPSILLDTGAVSASYMSTEFYNKHYDVLRHFTTIVNKTVRLGDSLTVKPIDKIVDVRLRVYSVCDYDPN